MEGKGEKKRRRNRAKCGARGGPFLLLAFSTFYPAEYCMPKSGTISRVGVPFPNGIPECVLLTFPEDREFSDYTLTVVK